MLNHNKQISTIYISHITCFNSGYVCMCVSLAPVLEPEHWAVWVWALWGKIVSVMANTILFANSSDYCSTGCQDPNKQIIPKTNASSQSCPSRADYAAASVCVCVCVSICVYVGACELSACICTIRSLNIWMFPMQQYALFNCCSISFRYWCYATYWKKIKLM